MSKLETNIIAPSTGTTLTLGESGDSIVVPSGVTITNNGTQTGFGGTNTPAFEAHLSSNATINNTANNKIPYNTELLDTNNCYDNTTNYRFTPTTAGYYYLYHKVQVYGDATNALRQISPSIWKNGSEYAGTEIGTYPDYILHQITAYSIAIIYLNGSTDYVEAYCYIDGTQSTGTLQSAANRSAFGGYKLLT